MSLTEICIRIFGCLALDALACVLLLIACAIAWNIQSRGCATLGDTLMFGSIALVCATLSTVCVMVAMNLTNQLYLFITTPVVVIGVYLFSDYVDRYRAEEASHRRL